MNVISTMAGGSDGAPVVTPLEKWRKEGGARCRSVASAQGLATEIVATRERISSFKLLLIFLRNPRRLAPAPPWQQGLFQELRC